MTYKPPRRPQYFYTTAPLPCPYVQGRIERKVVTEITGPDSDALHDRLSRAGFRRSHNIAYAPVCPNCSACVPIRIDTRLFEPDKSLKRVARANEGTEGFEVPARATAEQFALFQRYQQARHGDGDMATMSFYDYRAMVEDTPIETMVVEFRDAEDRLVGACLADRLGDGLSAVYQLFRARTRQAVARHLCHIVAGGARPAAGPALCVSGLLGAGEPQDGLQGAVQAEPDTGGRRLAHADGCRSGGARRSHEDAACAGDGGVRKAFFFEKKKQKTFGYGSATAGKKVFGSFFKKNSSYPPRCNRANRKSLNTATRLECLSSSG